ncbi:inositol phosphorylceramide synthase [Aneurinibacillus sp. Ricciae_BoGa-3]|uniref:inositol phosphorylceramide synthase n=1 Tax=Aneurinibacillus sp. Ricciae_BoGa-3 TaxID=3022697 RepID=UPI00233F8648|nr:inositol phosphorylceramide synthase [Aneurinibacillus sp. Ricciae_BoGa-3]WCK56581.1 inositol phosphorylceramide synthase [Aneurinibacillus sp. Ricciae_BoGa-3]
MNRLGSIAYTNQFKKSKTKNLIRKMTPVWLYLTNPLLGMLYGTLNNPHRGFHSLIIPLDGGIPFLKIFAIPYVIWSLFILASMGFFCVKDRSVFYTALVSYNVSLVVCYMFFYFYQTAIIRPQLTGSDLLTKLVAYVYRHDEPYNCFPSIHCVSSYLMIRAVHTASGVSWKSKTLIDTTALLIILSTLFIKQHAFVDVLGAIALAEITFRTISRWLPVTTKYAQRKRMPQPLSSNGTNIIQYPIKEKLYNPLIVNNNRTATEKK